MISKYFNSPVITPVLTGAAMHAAFAEGAALFDWISFEIPKGTARLTGATITIRPKGDAAPTHQPAGVDLVFAKDTAVSATPATIGALNAAAFLTPRHDIIGTLPAVAADIVGGATAVISTSAASPIVLEGEPSTGANVGYDKYWMAGVAAGAIDFTTITRINDGDIDSSSPGTTLVMDGSSMDIREHFIAGDVLVAHDDAAIGTVASLTNATTLELTEAIATSVLEDDDYVYCKNPIKIILHFEK